MGYSADVIDALWDQLSAEMGEDVIYTEGVEQIPVTAVPGRTRLDADLYGQVVASAEQMDWLIRADDLGREPAIGARIHADGREYTVGVPEIERQWDWVSQSRRVYRVHTILTNG